jgi:hypothetical protein
MVEMNFIICLFVDISQFVLQVKIQVQLQNIHSMKGLQDLCNNEFMLLLMICVTGEGRQLESKDV